MQKRGFSLVELIVVIAIVAILSTLVLFSLTGVREKARDAKRLSDMESIRQAMELVNDSFGNYSGQKGCAKEDIVSNACYGATITKYLLIAQLNDPLGGADCCNLDLCKQANCNYCFSGYLKDKKNYEIYFHLEKGGGIAKELGCYKLTKSGVEFIGGVE
ncbi:type II secretion system protein [Candidatus Falkowbacteria bacterium]|nr:type II secretion system protein [Candidatus Falkowbacteria bacterium]